MQRSIEVDPIHWAWEIRSSPWAYTLYAANGGRYFLSVPYSPKSYVDASMMLLLTAEETELMKSDEGWLQDFASRVRYSFSDYLPESVSPAVQQEVRGCAKQLGQHLRFCPKPEDVFNNAPAVGDRHFIPLLIFDASSVDPDLDTTLHFVTPIEPYANELGEYTAMFHSEFCRRNWIAFTVEDGKYRFAADEQYFFLEAVKRDAPEFRAGLELSEESVNYTVDELRAHYANAEAEFADVNAQCESDGAFIANIFGKLALQLGGYPTGHNFAQRSDIDIETREMHVPQGWEDGSELWARPLVPSYFSPAVEASLDPETATEWIDGYFPRTPDGRFFRYIGQLTAFWFGPFTWTLILFYDPVTGVALQGLEIT